jgi:hypothetical protein
MSSEFVSLVIGLLIPSSPKKFLNPEGEGGTFLRCVENKSIAAPSKNHVELNIQRQRCGNLNRL